MATKHSGAAGATPVPLQIPYVWALANLRALEIGLTTEEKQTFVDQLILLLEEFYTHLPLKQNMLAVSPVQRARLLKAELSEYRGDSEFFRELQNIFMELRDLHTNFVLPAPWRALVAFLPYAIDEYRDQFGRHYCVTKMSPFIRFGDHFQPKVEVTHWNGVPMHRKLSELALETAGANRAARHRRALARLTSRSLAFDVPPEEDWVTLTYVPRDGAGPQNMTVPWLVSMQVSRPPRRVDEDAAARVHQEHACGIDAEAMEVQRVRKAVLVPDLFRQEFQTPEAETPASSGELQSSTNCPKNLSHRTVTDDLGNHYGYLRIWNFEVDDVGQFVEEVKTLVERFPPNGLIIDVRGNPGGFIPAGERLLQLFTTKRITPQPVSFRNTRGNLQVANASWELAQSGIGNDFLQPWRASLELGVKTGEVFSQGFPLTTPEEANDTGQKYRGPVVLIIDALCYSTTDFFAAGFKDHGIGTILGVDERTGAGGANVWSWDWLRWYAAAQGVTQLPRGATMRVALRRSTRVGERIGIPVEGLGVQADVQHEYTFRDICEQNQDLIAQAIQILRSNA